MNGPQCLLCVQGTDRERYEDRKPSKSGPPEPEKFDKSRMKRNKSVWLIPHLVKQLKFLQSRVLKVIKAKYTQK